MQTDLIFAFFAVALGASGTYLLLPHKHGAILQWRVHAVGAALFAISLLVFGFYWTAPSELLSKLFFYLFGMSAIIGAILTVTVTNPIHCALWFASVVLSTSGLFLLAGAQFLAAGTIIVYAGAIIVTFLFVIMLAQMEGRAAYDRASRSPFRATWTCFVLFFGLVWSLFHIERPVEVEAVAKADVELSLVKATQILRVTKFSRFAGVSRVLAQANRPTAQLTDASGVEKAHVAGLGETLYTDHLVTVELAGALLFAALIGAIAIATPKAPIRPGNRSAAPVQV